MKNSFKVLFFYLKYQVITKVILSIIIFPIYSLILNLLIRSTGRVNVSSGDFLPFLFSFQGLGLLVITVILFLFLMAIDINSFIILSSLIHEKKMFFCIKDTLKIAIKSIKLLFSMNGVFMFFYVGLIIPILGLGITISPMKNFQIPNFITSVIHANDFFLAIYVVILLIFLVFAIVFSFTFHYMIIKKLNWENSIKSSINLIKSNFKNFIKDFVLLFLGIFSFYVASTVLFIVIFVVLIDISNFTVFIKRVLSFLVVITNFQIFDLVSLLFVPIVIHRLTFLFYKYNKIEESLLSLEYKIKEVDAIESKNRTKKNIFIWIILAISIFVFNIFTSIWMSKEFDSLFEDKKYALITHRAGGNLAAENSLEGLKEAIKHKAMFSEIDVQRTKDGKYIINHDKTFKRLCNVSKSSDEMNLDEIKKLKVKNEFDSEKEAQEVATLEEMLDLAKDKIGLFIELKGKTADHKMVDDVIKMVKQRNMEKQIVLLSLDYSLIQYIEEKYPNIDSGYLYFFSIGKTENMIADYFIMEEREATENNIELIQEKGKKAIVWTVNTKDSIQRFINSDVDGIITDYIEDVKEALVEKENRSDLEIIFQQFIIN